MSDHNSTISSNWPNKFDILIQLIKYMYILFIIGIIYLSVIIELNLQLYTHKFILNSFLWGNALEYLYV